MLITYCVNNLLLLVLKRLSTSVGLVACHGNRNS